MSFTVTAIGSWLLFATVNGPPRRIPCVGSCEMRKVFWTGLATNLVLLGLFIMLGMALNTWYWRTFP